MGSRLWVLFLIACGSGCASDDPAEILRRLDAKVISHLNKVANYMCVQTVERTYLGFPGQRNDTCEVSRLASKQKLLERDRLRLDVAVAGGKEVYSWHADNKFSTGLINEVVKRGPVSSGGFVGFLANIFGTHGVQFRFKGKRIFDSAEVYSFDYSVPLSASHYEIGSGSGNKLVPFHGSFSAYAANYELASLTITADNIPPAVGICSSRNDVTYQLVPVAGNELLLPRTWTLRIGTPVEFTESRSEYTGCREFSGESTIHYSELATDSPQTSPKPVRVENLPPGLMLRIRLLTPIDGDHSYTGDPVEGELIKSVVEGIDGGIIPKGAKLHGVITRLEHRYEPLGHYLLNIEFESLRSGDRSFVLHARPELTRQDTDELRWIYGPRTAAFVIDEARGGLLIFSSRHLHLGSHFSALWVTE